jgi:hypothetical protein
MYEVLSTCTEGRIIADNIEQEEKDLACLVIYNYAMLFVKPGRIDDAISKFEKVTKLNREDESIVGDASVLNRVC